MGKVTAEDVEALVEVFDASDWTELHVAFEGFEIYLSKDPAGHLAPSKPAQGAVASVSAPASSPHATPRQPIPAASKGAIADGLAAVCAPNLGTFYRAPKPGAPPYVELGQRVEVDTEVCLIEVMKLFTPLKAGLSGTVREILASDGEMVEFDQLLFLIEPAA
jgi:acetyl-CoA carboxylase biotin carboxyl carrier protein